MYGKAVAGGVKNTQSALKQSYAILAVARYLKVFI